MSASRAPRWTPIHPVPWPGTGSPHVDLLRAAVEQHLYPYGDLISTPGRCVATHQLSTLQRARAQGMDDAEACAFLAVTLSMGGNTVYRRDHGTLCPVGYVAFSGHGGPRDCMGRSEIRWTIGITPLGEATLRNPSVAWNQAALADSFRRAFDIPFRDIQPVPAPVLWEGDQTLLF